MAKALLVMDMQVGIVARLKESSTLLQNIKATIEAARKKGLTVIYVTVSFRKGSPEISSNNKMVSTFAATGFFDDENNLGIHPAVTPLPGDILTVKRRISAFTGSDLEVVLRAQQFNEIILCGVSTSGVVLSTVREASDKDYAITVLEDCCADADEEVHAVLTKKVFPRQATVITHTAWMEALNN